MATRQFYSQVPIVANLLMPITLILGDEMRDRRWHLVPPANTGPRIVSLVPGGSYLCAPFTVIFKQMPNSLQLAVNQLEL